MNRILRALLFGSSVAITAFTAAAQLPDPAPFDTLLRANVNAGQVNYPGFQDAAELKTYLASLAKPVDLKTRPEQLAYNINAYNAYAIQGILDGLSPSTFFGRLRYFKNTQWPLAGRRIALHDIEHEVLRPLGDPRIHFAIICASKSCPFLRSEAYTAAKLDAQLDEQARQFINDPSRNRFDKATKTAQLSEIFKWFEDDFKGPGSLQKYLAKYANDADVAKILASDGFKVDWIPYDWSLNGTPPRR
ncbi:MAG TPA: DUF547 domain-containing protein [Casimicrobiaceae bacterium]|nr:DUF547 domain-containing protein [Casimicrobiaceae bacterium]